MAAPSSGDAVPHTRPPPVVLVGGVTASGKSALAIDLAEAFDGVVVNADSMQVYRELRVLTARPTSADEARVPHRLFGHRPAAIAWSAADWRREAASTIAGIHAAGRLPIVTGGTGLYLQTLTEGLSPVPEIDDAVRRDVRAFVARSGPALAHRRLAALDPPMAARLSPGDAQRIARAIEVREATGRSLSEWQALPPGPRPAWRTASILLVPSAATVDPAIEARFRRMVGEGGLDEAADVRALGLDPALPAAKAVGLPELIDHLDGRTSREQAIETGIRATRRYAKRQRTWFRNRAPASDVPARRFDAQYSERIRRQVFSLLHEALLIPRG